MSENTELQESLGPYVTKTLEYVDSGRVLDVGCGVGKASLYFARRGLSVDAVDKNGEDLQILQEQMENEDLDITIHEMDMLEFSANCLYDIIVADKSVYFLPPQLMNEMLRKIQDMTRPEGMNAVSVWSDDNAAHEGRTPSSRYYLRMMYEKWDTKQLWVPTNPAGQKFFAITAQKIE